MVKEMIMLFQGLVAAMLAAAPLVVQVPVYFSDEQLSRPLVIASPSPTPSPSPSPSPTPSPEPTASASASLEPIVIEEQIPIVAEMETEHGKIKYNKILKDVWAVSYDSSCAGCSDTTATGMKQGYGVVAVDPKVIPLYSRVYVPGYGIGIAGDVGGAVKGKMIDLGYDKLEGQWSARYVDVYLLVE